MQLDLTARERELLFDLIEAADDPTNDIEVRNFLEKMGGQLQPLSALNKLSPPPLTPDEVQLALETAVTEMLRHPARIVDWVGTEAVLVSREVAERIHQLATNYDGVGEGGYIYDHRFRLATDAGARLEMCADCTGRKHTHIVQS